MGHSRATVSPPGTSRISATLHSFIRPALHPASLPRSLLPLNHILLFDYTDPDIHSFVEQAHSNKTTFISGTTKSLSAKQDLNDFNRHTFIRQDQPVVTQPTNTQQALKAYLPASHKQHSNPGASTATNDSVSLIPPQSQLKRSSYPLPAPSFNPVQPLEYQDIPP